jgi:Cu+-exporting ATPase
VAVPPPPATVGSIVHIACNGEYRGCYTLANALRPQADTAIRALARDYQLALLSGDNERERERFRELFGDSSPLRFNQSPLHKLNFIQEMQAPGQTVMMVGDGLNDAGALKQSDVGVAVVESIGAFSPASDIIMAADMVPRLQEVLRFAKSSVRVVRLSLLISALYNVVGLSIAARGQLSPVICAILMPLSSVTVVAFACGLTTRLGRRLDAGALEVEAAV